MLPGHGEHAPARGEDRREDLFGLRGAPEMRDVADDRDDLGLGGRRESLPQSRSLSMDVGKAEDPHRVS